MDALREHNQRCADTPVTPGRVAGLLVMPEKDEINANAARDSGGHERALLMVALDLQLRSMPEVHIPVSNPKTDFQTMQKLSNTSSTGWKK
ncbi:MAG: hypothetical protein NTZ24_04055 [Deltaproteobacteria bacterium]|nr:hypothetical protein [Deltaproteobacteria bacterium]